MTPEAPPELTRTRLFALGGAAALVPLNSTMIAVALPRIADDFGISVGRTSWLVTVYLVVMLVGQPLAGRTGDRFGTSRVVEISLYAFAAASIAAAVAPTFELLVAGRVAQAVFGAALVPGAQAIVRTATSPSERGRRFGLLGSLLGVGAASGPIVGGVLIEIFGWPSIFVANLPIVAWALVVGLPAPATPAEPVPDSPPEPARPLVRNGVFVAAFGVQAHATLGQYMLLLVAPVLLDARGWSPASIGVGLSGLTVGMIVMSPLGGTAGDRHGRRWPVVIGLAACVLSLGAGTVGGTAIEPALLIAALAGFGFGFGFALPSIQTAALEAVDARRVGAAAGVLSMSRYVGSITTSLLVAAWLTSDGGGARPALGVATVASLVALLLAGRLSSDPMGPPAVG